LIRLELKLKFFSMTPTEIRKKEFKKSMWGFSPGEVVSCLEQVAKTLEKSQRTERELNEKLRLANEELTRWKNKELEMQKLRERAVHDAEAVRQEATKEAERIFGEVEERANEIRKKTEEWLENVIAEVEETERQKMNFMTAFRAALDSHYAILKTEQEEGQPLGAKLNQFLSSAFSGTHPTTG
jgi:cell division initiation protein